MPLECSEQSPASQKPQSREVAMCVVYFLQTAERVQSSKGTHSETGDANLRRKQPSTGKSERSDV